MMRFLSNHRTAVAPSGTDRLLSSLPTEAPVLRGKPALPEGPSALGRAGEDMAGFKAARLGFTAGDTVLGNLDQGFSLRDVRGSCGGSQVMHSARCTGNDGAVLCVVGAGSMTSVAAGLDGECALVECLTYV